MVHRFSLRKRGWKVRAEQQEVSSPVRSHSPLTFSVDESAILESQDSLEEVASSENVKGERGQLQQRILKLTEQVRVQQANRNANLSEYLHLVSNADRIQAHRLKQAFEKRNQSLSSVITQLQRKLEHYVKRQQDLDRGLSPLPSKDLSRIITQGLQHTGRGLSDDTQDGPASGSMLSTDSSTSRSNLLVDTKSDTQDFTNLKASDEPQQESFRSLYRPIQPSLQPTMIDDQYSMVTASSEEPLDMSDITSPRSNSLDRQNLGFLTVLEELTEVKEKQLNLELNFKNMAERYNQDYLAFEESLQEERYRSDQLQAELNDLIDLHQNEVLNLKSELASLEEKIAYQSYESSRDIWEVLEAFQTKMIRLEQLQQVAQVEVLDHPNTRELLGKSMNLLLIIFAVVLMLMSTISALILPFVKTRTRAVTTSMVIVLLIVVWHNWEFFSTLIPRRLIYHWR